LQRQVPDVKSILLLLPLFFIQSCESVSKVALKCREQTNLFVLGQNYKYFDDFYYLIDYSKNEIFGYSPKEIYRYKDLMVAPVAITFSKPRDEADKIYSIDRNSLDISAERTTPYSTEKVVGKCSKTPLPNLSSYGKQI
jgi:hypothetical protein